MKNTLNTVNQYPVILMHGAAGWGEQEWITKAAPYFGWFKGNVPKLYRSLGIDAFTPGSGPFTGGWVRSCDLYAQILGGTTDYGKAFSERTGCARYGRTYDKPLIPDWGTLDAEGKRKKICLIGHSYGAPTMRFFLSLLAYGSAEERAVTPEDELSDLFKGGKADWVHAATTLAGAHNGLSLTQPFDNGLLRPVWGGFCFVMSLLFDIPLLKHFWDMRLDPYGLTSAPGQKMTSLKDKLRGTAILSKEKLGSIAYDTCFEGAEELEEKFPIPDNIYYFAYYGNVMVKNGDHFNYVPKKDSFMLSRVFAYASGAVLFPKKGLTEEWLQCDGLVPVPSANGPKHAKKEPFTTLDNCKPGIWYQMPVEVKDHHSYEGSGEDPKVYAEFMTQVLSNMENLPTID